MRSGSFTIAARQLGVSRALVSRHIIDLEKQVRKGLRAIESPCHAKRDNTSWSLIWRPAAIASPAPQPTRPQRLHRALGAGQIVDDRGGVLRRYRSLVGVDHLIHDLLPNLTRQRRLIQRVIGRMT